MPSQQRVWADGCFQLGQRFSPERICLSGESPSFGVGDTDAAFAQWAYKCRSYVLPFLPGIFAPTSARSQSVQGGGQLPGLSWRPFAERKLRKSSERSFSVPCVVQNRLKVTNEFGMVW